MHMHLEYNVSYFAEAIEQSKALMINLAEVFPVQKIKSYLTKLFSFKLIVPLLLMSDLLLF